VCGERVLAAVTEDGKAYFSPRHVCDALGIRWGAQFVKIKADPVLAGVVSEIETTGRDGKTYKMSMLPIEYANGWLFTIKKVRPELQAKLNLFRTEGYAALDAWFRQGLRNDPEVQLVLSFFCSNY
jgi:hypothetical protein